MKKINSSGFVLAETLVVTVFLMVIFGMIYTNFYPLIGEYEKRENYDDVDGVYNTYWIKKLIEDSSYNMKVVTGEERENEKKAKYDNFTKYHFWRFECSDVDEADDKRSTCINLVTELQVNGCDRDGNNCDIFITDYHLGIDGDNNDFKDIIENGIKTSKTTEDGTIEDEYTPLKKYQEDCKGSDAECEAQFMTKCQASGFTENECQTKKYSKLFKSGFQDYVRTLPDYKTNSLNDAEYRVLVVYHHTKDNNNYYSYSTIEVNK